MANPKDPPDPLFAWALRNALARNSDPASSHLAAADLRQSGRHLQQKRWTLALLTAHNGATCRQLATIAAGTADMAGNSLAMHTLGRRLPDLEKAGLVVKGPLSHAGPRPAVTWWLRGTAPLPAAAAPTTPLDGNSKISAEDDDWF